MPKLNKTQKYAIQWLHHLGHDIDTISKELNITQNQIEKIISIKNETPTIESTFSSSPSAKDHMITHTSGKRINSVAIMTKEASEIADSAKKNITMLSDNLDSKKGIFRPNKK